MCCVVVQDTFFSEWHLKWGVNVITPTQTHTLTHPLCYVCTSHTYSTTHRASCTAHSFCDDLLVECISFVVYLLTYILSSEGRLTLKIHPTGDQVPARLLVSLTEKLKSSFFICSAIWGHITHPLQTSQQQGRCFKYHFQGTTKLSAQLQPITSVRGNPGWWKPRVVHDDHIHTQTSKDTHTCIGGWAI